MCFEKDAEKSRRAFDKFTRYALNRHFDGNKLIRSFEGSQDPVERELDIKHSIDGVIVDRDNWAHYFASRALTAQGFLTFTVRGDRPTGTATEIHKIRRVGEPKPEYHVQTYVDSDGQGAIVGIVETIELVQYIDRHKPAKRRNGQDGVGFYAVDFVEPELATAKVYYVGASGNVTDCPPLWALSAQKK